MQIYTFNSDYATITETEEPKYSRIFAPLKLFIPQNGV
jgi:hypothetical protein